MSPEGLPLVFSRGERAVCHAVDPSTPVSELPSLLALYFGDGHTEGARLVWRSEEGLRPLEPGRPIGEQVPADAEIELEPA